MATDEKLLADFDKAQSDRTNWDTTWQAIDNLLRSANQFNNKRNQGSRRRRHIYDTTGIQASRQFAFSLHGFLTNPAQKWFNLHPHDTDLRDDEQSLMWLQDARDAMLGMFAMPEFGFNTHAFEAYQDITEFGTGVMTVIDAPSGSLRFRARRLADIYLRGDSDGNIVRIYRKYSLANWEAILRFGQGKVADEARRDKQENEEREYVQCIYWRQSFDPTRADGPNKPIASVHIDIDARKRVRESGFDDWPYIVARMSKNAEEVYGRSLAMDALPEIGLVNQMAKSQIVALEKAIDPPLEVAANSIEGPIRTAPGSVIWRRHGSQPGQINPLPPPNVQEGEKLLEIRQQSIRNTFFHDIVGPLPENDRMTATEIMQRVQQRMQILSPMLARLQEEMLSPLIKRTFRVMSANGMLSAPPDHLRGRGLEIDYVGPLALAQKASDVGNFQQLMEIVAMMAQNDPSALDNIDTDEATRGSAGLLNAPMRFMRRPREVRERRAQRQRMENAAQQAEIGRTAAEAAERGAKAAQTLGEGRQA